MTEKEETPLLSNGDFEFADRLTTVDSFHRIAWLDASLTILSRKLFQECVTKKDEDSAKRIEMMKHCYWDLTYDLKTRLFSSDVSDKNLFPFVDIVGFLVIFKKYFTPEQYQEFVSFPYAPETILEPEVDLHIFGCLRYHMFGIEAFRQRIEPAFNIARSLYQEGKIKYFFGNVSAGNFDSALLAQYCKASENQYRLYQYSRRAARQFGEEAGHFRSIDNEFAGIDKNGGILIIDAFSTSGQSAPKSVEGFRKNGFTGPIFFYNSIGIPADMGRVTFNQINSEDPMRCASIYEIVDQVQ